MTGTSTAAANTAGDVYCAASGPQRGAGAVAHYERLLEAGINVVTTTSTELVFPPAADESLRDRLSRAAVAGGASLYASGIFPGFASDQLPVLLTTLSRNIETIRLVEVSLNAADEGGSAIWAGRRAVGRSAMCASACSGGR